MIVRMDIRVLGDTFLFFKFKYSALCVPDEANLENASDCTFATCCFHFKMNRNPIWLFVSLSSCLIGVFNMLDSFI